MCHTYWFCRTTLFIPVTWPKNEQTAQKCVLECVLMQYFLKGDHARKWIEIWLCFWITLKALSSMVWLQWISTVQTKHWNHSGNQKVTVYITFWLPHIYIEALRFHPYLLGHYQRNLAIHTILELVIFLIKRYSTSRAIHNTNQHQLPTVSIQFQSASVCKHSFIDISTTSLIPGKKTPLQKGYVIATIIGRDLFCHWLQYKLLVNTKINYDEVIMAVSSFQINCIDRAQTSSFLHIEW